jgi:DNA-directed RNA polymerase subunit H (RpoH/RPB5)
MKINFTGHSINQRETVLSQEELAEIFEALKYQFITHIEYTSNFQRQTDYETPETIRIRKLCETHGVDVDYTPDRLNFFTAILEKMENPYV